VGCFGPYTELRIQIGPIFFGRFNCLGPHRDGRISDKFVPFGPNPRTLVMRGASELHLLSMCIFNKD
jgi:hypothetical protein